ncbi:hypothetical protein AA650_06480 [Anabaena sp. WA102]|jgi:hypothetical protein|nr:hypothetical protein AA650_06480 [Anabaena sp. WA102]OBQ17523.1 MAG: hypothetical protein AN486_14950 [Anabaena sp. AL93]
MVMMRMMIQSFLPIDIISKKITAIFLFIRTYAKYLSEDVFKVVSRNFHHIVTPLYKGKGG